MTKKKDNLEGKTIEYEKEGFDWSSLGILLLGIFFICASLITLAKIDDTWYFLTSGIISFTTSILFIALGIIGLRKPIKIKKQIKINKIK